MATTDDRVTEQLVFANNRLLIDLFGALGVHLTGIEEHLGVSLHPFGNGVTITAPERQAKAVRRLLETLYMALERGHVVDEKQVQAGIQTLKESESFGPEFSRADTEPLGEDEGGGSFPVEFSLRTPRLLVYPRNPRQTAYIRTLATSALTFAVGPAGTGKTYLAVATAVASLMEGCVARIILTRPAIEAGERLGFLPGDLHAKVDPYLRPLYDALHDMLGSEKVERMLSRHELEIAPLAYMRGRTLDEAFIILDEAQNATKEQMKMFLTRFGAGSKVAVSGDITQIDLPKGEASGLVQAIEILKNLEGIGFVYFTCRDIVRHPLVRQIAHAYEQAGAKKSCESKKHG